jgi:hypothetical protein
LYGAYLDRQREHLTEPPGPVERGVQVGHADDREPADVLLALQAKIVRAAGGRAPVVSDGPFPETKEFLAGWWIVDCETAERAIELAAIVSAAPGPGGRPLDMPIEVRAVMSAPSGEV